MSCAIIITVEGSDTIKRRNKVSRCPSKEEELLVGDEEKSDLV